MATVDERIQGELPKRRGADFGFPRELDRMSVNRLLSLFHLLGNVRLSTVAETLPVIDNATERLRKQAAVALALAEALSCWPAGWQRLQDMVNAKHFGRHASAYHLVTRDEALSPFRILERTPQSEAADYPAMLRLEMRRQLAQRGVTVGRRRLFAAEVRHDDERYMKRQRLKKLWSSYPIARCKFSRQAVQELLHASTHQMGLLYRAGILSRPIERWTQAPDFDGALDRLTERVRGRSQADRTRFVALSEFSTESGDELVGHLIDIREGRTPCVRWSHMSPPSLQNMFIPASGTL